MRKAYLLPSLLSGALLLTACTPATDTTNPTDDSSSSSMMMDDSSSMSDHDMSDMNHDMSSMPMDGSSSSATTSSAASSVEASSTSPQATRVIEMTVEDFKFAPNAIKVKKGEKVVVRLHDLDGTHSFGSQELGINVAVPAGETKDIPIPTDKAGTFSFRCTIPCGPGHMGMTGTIVVEA